MLKIQLILMCICAQIFLINCYTINHFPVSINISRWIEDYPCVLQRPIWSELESESNDDLLKILHTESLFNELNPPIASSSAVALLDQTDGHPRGLQKRGRRTLIKNDSIEFHLFFVECLWKVCSWALDKRSLRSTPNSVDTLSKLFY